MSPKSNPERRLSKLELQKRDVEEKIAIERRKLRAESRVRAAIRHRVLGQSLVRLQERGRIDDALMRAIKDDLLHHVFGRAEEFESLQGTAFDLTALLHDRSVPTA